MTRDEEEVNDLLETVDPKYHDAIRTALLGLANWYGDKAYKQIDDWFTIVYGLILDLEDTLACERKHIEVPISINIDDIVAKPKRPEKWIDD